MSSPRRDRVVLACSGGLDASVAIETAPTPAGSGPWTVLVPASSERGGGGVRRGLHADTCTVSGRRSATSLHEVHLAACDAEDTFVRSLTKGFAGPWGTPSRVAACHDQGLREQVAP